MAITRDDGDATHVEKVRRIFEEMSKDGHMVSLEGFTQLFNRCKVDLGNETVREIFSNAAVTNEVMMSFAEFQMWAEQYPTILDCVFFRLRDLEEEVRQKRQLKEMDDQLAAARLNESDTEAMHREAVGDLEESRRAAQATERRVQEVSEREGVAKAKMEEARARTASHRAQLREEQSAIAGLRDEERQWQHRIEAAQRDTQAALSSLRAAEAELRELQRELQRRAADVEASKTAVRTAYDREAQLAQDAEAVARRVRESETALSSLEETLHVCAVSEQDAMASYRDVAQDVSRQHEALDKAAADMKDRTERVHHAAAAVEAAVGRSKELSRQLDSQERSHAAFSAQRHSTGAEEAELLQEEVALRRQRMMLESREARLRNRSISSARKAGSNSPPPPPHAPHAAHARAGSVSGSSLSPHYDHTHARRTTIDLPQVSPVAQRSAGSPDRWAPQSSPSPAGTQRRGGLDSPRLTRSEASQRRDYLRSPVNMGGGAASPGAFSPSGYDTGRYGAGGGSPSRRLEEAENHAERLYRAMKGFGTDEAAIYGVLGRVRSNAEWAEVRNAFKKRYQKFHGGDLVRAMQDDLTRKEFEKCVNLLADKGVILRG